MSGSFGFTPDDDQPGQGGGNPFGGIEQFGAMLEQIGRMMSAAGTPAQGAINWDLAKKVARQQAVAQPDPTPTAADQDKVAAAVRLAELWLDERTTFPAASGAGRAWSRSEWVEATLPAWQKFINPIAEQTQSMLGSALSGQGANTDNLPESVREMLPPGFDLGQMAGPLLGMARQLGSATFAMQAGQGLGHLSQEVVGACDIGVPLVSDGHPTLIPVNLQTFAEGLEVPLDEVRLFLALREAAHQRLFAHVPWLAARLTGAVEEYARGIHIDIDRITQAASSIDPTNPEALQEVMSSGVFEPQDTPAQEAAKARLETLLALVEGWVAAVVDEACRDRLPSSGRLSEAIRRRRATGGPAEKTFATLIGLELRPRRLREAAAFWAAVAQVDGSEGRDRVWGHPDLLPTGEDLDRPGDFLDRSGLSLPEDLLPGPGSGGEEGDSDDEDRPNPA